jgi:PPK2 family polyphosphate:nucleotide phosphotransferase
MSSYRERFRVQPGSKVRLLDVDPGFKDGGNKAEAEAETAKDAERLRQLQYLLYAEGRQSLLIVLQGLDGAGKDGTINHVLGAMNPQGTRVHAFKVPTPEEAAHDFMWRIHLHAPRRGEVVIFNRSHYEDVLVVRVHDLVAKKVWSRRYDRINSFEKGLVDNQTHILKFYLHIDAKEQLRRFEQRLDDPTRQWKISEADYTERAFWPQYVEAYEEAIARTSTEDAPWFLIPANHKWFRNLAIGRIVIETLEQLELRLPTPKVDLEAMRRRYHAAEHDQAELEKDLSKLHH